jgi:RNase P subunit RPR2
MRALVNYLRQVFCAHDWLKEEDMYTMRYEGKVIDRNTRVSLTCNKCGYHRKYMKFKPVN